MRLSMTDWLRVRKLANFKSSILLLWIYELYNQSATCRNRIHLPYYIAPSNCFLCSLLTLVPGFSFCHRRGQVPTTRYSFGRSSFFDIFVPGLWDGGVVYTFSLKQSVSLNQSDCLRNADGELLFQNGQDPHHFFSSVLLCVQGSNH